MDQVKSKRAVATLSVASNSALVLGKLLIGLITGSVSVLSEAIHSGVDLVAAAIALFSVNKAAKPPDPDHPYGHGKVENISGLVEALLIFLAAGWVIYEAVQKLRYPEPLTQAWLGALVMAVSAGANFVVSQRLFQVARETESIALEADAWHLRTDVYTSAGVMGGLAVIAVLTWAWPAARVDFIDPVVAIAVALLIVQAAYELTIKAARDLLDERLPEPEENVLGECILGHRPHVLGYHRLRTRRSGGSRFVDVHVEVPGSMSVDESHGIADSIEAQMRQRFPNISVTVHIEPRSVTASAHD